MKTTQVIQKNLISLAIQVIIIDIVGHFHFTKFNLAKRWIIFLYMIYQSNKQNIMWYLNVTIVVTNFFVD